MQNTKPITSYADIFALFADIRRETLARELGLKNESHISTMKSRGRIPPNEWPTWIDVASTRGVPLTAEALGVAEVAFQRARVSPELPLKRLTARAGAAA